MEVDSIRHATREFVVPETTRAILRHLALKRPCSMYSLAKNLEKSYGNIHSNIRMLADLGLITVEYKRKSEKNRKIEVKYYRLTLDGLFDILSLDASLWNDIDSIADTYKEQSLIFQKWIYFKENGLRNVIVDTLQRAIISLTVGQTILYGSEQTRDEALTKRGIDSLVLGCHALQNKGKDISPDEAKILEACKRDETLHMYVLEELRSLERLNKQNLHKIKEGLTYMETRS